MEYIMSYSWIIIIIMIVGLAMWRLGLLNPWDRHQMRVEGFGELRVQEAGCGIEEDTIFDHYSNAGGGGSSYWDDRTFSCTFLNTHGAKIFLYGVDVDLTGSDGSRTDCYYSMASETQQYYWKPMIVDFGTWFLGTYVRCYDGTEGSCVDVGDNTFLLFGFWPMNMQEAPIDVNHHFVVSGVSMYEGWDCWDIIEQGEFEADITLEYYIQLGEALVPKKTSGRIYYKD